METYDIYHGKINGSLSIIMKPKPHVYIDTGPWDSNKEKVFIPKLSLSDQNSCILVKWTFTSPERGSSYIEKPDDGVEVLGESSFSYDGMVISSTIALLKRGQEIHAATVSYEPNLLRRARKMKWTLEYDGKLPVVKEGKWKKEPILFRRFRNF